jgi:coatomer subunit beta
VLATSLTKLVLRFSELTRGTAHSNALRAEAMLIMTSIIRIGRSEFVSSPIDEDSSDRIQLCLKTLGTAGGDPILKTVFLEDTRKAFTQLVAAEEDKAAKKKAADKKAAEVQVDDVISFRQLKSKRALADGADEYDIDLTRATGLTAGGDDYISKLNRVVQLTGFSDPVYAEAYVNVHQYDILLDVLIVNQTSETLQNLTLEFSTLGDLKLVERPAPYTVPPRGFHSIKANIKVSSTETGVIFGNIVYDGPGALDTTCVILNDIHIGGDQMLPCFRNDGLTCRCSQTSWTTSCRLSAPKPNSVPCGPSLSGRTRSTSTPTSRISWGGFHALFQESEKGSDKQTPNDSPAICNI